VLGRLLEIVVLLLAVRAVWRMLSSIVTISRGARRTTASRGGGEPQAHKLVRDPVCGTFVSLDSAIYQDGNYFCSEKCRDDYKRQAS